MWNGLMMMKMAVAGRKQRLLALFDTAVSEDKYGIPSMDGLDRLMCWMSSSGAVCLPSRNRLLLALPLLFAQWHKQVELFKVPRLSKSGV